MARSSQFIMYKSIHQKPNLAERAAETADGDGEACGTRKRDVHGKEKEHAAAHTQEHSG